MKKLAIVVLLVVSACRRQTIVTTAPPTTSPTTPAASGEPGAATPREALVRFLATAKAQDLQAMSLIWGDARGPARNTMDRETLEMREVYIMKCLNHDSWSVKSDSPVVGSRRQFSVELKLKHLTAMTDFVAVQGPGSRWFIEKVDPLGPLCGA